MGDGDTARAAPGTHRARAGRNTTRCGVSGSADRLQVDGYERIYGGVWAACTMSEHDGVVLTVRLDADCGWEPNSIE